MLAKRIIPCLDVDGGRVVKGVNFVDIQDAGDPVEVAHRYDQQGADELTFLDITASSDHRETMVDVVARTAREVFMPLTVGGGIRSVEDMETMLNAGADKVSINTSAVLNPDLIDQGSNHFGSQCIVVAIDARSTTHTRGQAPWEVYTHGGRQTTGKDAVEWAREVESRGAGEILLTSMDCDGTRDGYDLELTSAIAKAVQIPVIASGGAGCLHHLFEAVTTGCADAALVASIFHYGEYKVSDAHNYLRERGVVVRAV